MEPVQARITLPGTFDPELYAKMPHFQTRFLNRAISFVFPSKYPI